MKMTTQPGSGLATVDPELMEKYEKALADPRFSAFHQGATKTHPIYLSGIRREIPLSLVAVLIASEVNMGVDSPQVDLRKLLELLACIVNRDGVETHKSA